MEENRAWEQHETSNIFNKFCFETDKPIICVSLLLAKVFVACTICYKIKQHELWN